MLGCPMPVGRGSHEVPTGEAPRCREKGSSASVTGRSASDLCPRQGGTVRGAAAKRGPEAPASLRVSGRRANS